MNFFGIDSEYNLMRSVLLCRPSINMQIPGDPSIVLYERELNYLKVYRELTTLGEFFRKNNITVCFADEVYPVPVDCYNIMYIRDTFFMTPMGAIVANMYYDIRKKEIFYIQNVLERLKIPILGKIEGEATLEGADVIWLKEDLVVVGVGNRTNRAGYLYLKEILSKQGIKCIPVGASLKTIHLLGALQLIDKDLVLLRKESLQEDVIDILKKNNIYFISVPESYDVIVNYAFNIVVVAPKKIIMPLGCSQMRNFYEFCGISVIGQVDVREMINGRGGIGCATGIIARELLRYNVANL